MSGRYPTAGLYSRYVRRATAVGGRELTVYAAQNVNFYAPRSPRCIAALRRDTTALRDATAPGATTGAPYRAPLTRTVTVHDNVVAFVVARALDDALAPTRVTWLGPGGAVVRASARF